MIEVRKVEKVYLECITCGSNQDVHFLTFQYFGTNKETSLKLCKSCRAELKAKLETIHTSV